MSIPAITPAALPVIPQLTLPSLTGTPGSTDFGQVLQATINQVEQSGKDADTAVKKFLTGEEGELHTTALAAQKADLQFDLFLQVRNKVVSGYQEIMRMTL